MAVQAQAHQAIHRAAHHQRFRMAAQRHRRIRRADQDADRPWAQAVQVMARHRAAAVQPEAPHLQVTAVRAQTLQATDQVWAVQVRVLPAADAQV